MAPIRVRHPKGIATLQLDLDALTVQDLQQEIFNLSEIPPSQQESELFAVSLLTCARLSFFSQSDRDILHER